MSLRKQTGIHFSDPWLMIPATSAAANIVQYDASDASNTSATTAFFTGITKFGVQDTTNWTADTYKTIYSHTGMGLIAGMIACTAGGAETTTFEITIDGVKSEITVTNASGERALLHCALNSGTSDFTTATSAQKQANDGFNAGLNTASNLQSNPIVPSRWLGLFGVPLLRYNISALVRMKHSASITNSTATAYSGVWVRKGIAS